MKLGKLIKVIGSLWSQYAISIYQHRGDVWTTHSFNSLSDLEDYIYAMNMKLDERRVINLLPFDATGIDIILEDEEADHAQEETR